MKRNRFTEEQIIGILKEHEAGVSVADLCRKHGVSDGRFYGELGIAAVAFGVGGSGQHGPDEYADLTTVVPYYRALSDFLCAGRQLS